MIDRVKIPETMHEAVIKVENEPVISLADRFFGIFGMTRVTKEEEIQEAKRSPYCIREWKEWEVMYLRENYNNLKLKEMSEYLNRPISTLYSKMQREGIIRK